MEIGILEKPRLHFKIFPNPLSFKIEILFPCLHIWSDGEGGLSVRWHVAPIRGAKHKWEYKLQNVATMALPLDPLANCIYIQHETSRTCLQPRLSLDSSVTQYYFPNHRPIILILKCSFLWKKRLYDPFRGWGSTASRLEWEPLWGVAVYFLLLSSQKLRVLIFYQPLKDKQLKYWHLIQSKDIDCS